MIAGLSPLRHRLPVRVWALGLAAGFLVCAMVAPVVLRPLNRIWTRFGLLLHRITNPVILAVVYFGVFTPFGLLYRRVFRQQLLSLGLDAKAESYWTVRTAPTPDRRSMLNQW
jgi:fumarate reductase subunit D